MSEIERYNGLTTADKPALLDAKARGAEWVARDESTTLWGYVSKPHKTRVRGDFQTWAIDDFNVVLGAIDIEDDLLPFIQWSDPEPVNIDLALAQIAEMESAEKPEGCDICRGIKILSGTFHGVIRIDDETQMEVDSDGDVDFDFCPVCGRNLNSPYTEGETE